MDRSAIVDVATIPVGMRRPIQDSSRGVLDGHPDAFFRKKLGNRPNRFTFIPTLSARPAADPTARGKITMHEILNRNTYFIKEQVGMFKSSNSYDVYDPETDEHLLLCREPKLGFFTKLFRFTKYKRLTPFNVVITTPEGDPVLRVQRGVTFFNSYVKVFDENDEEVGGFKQKFFSIFDKFNVVDASGEPVCKLSGNFLGRNFEFKYEDRVLAKVEKKWAGLAKEMFTSADNYVMKMSRNLPEGHNTRVLIMAAVVCIDMVLKE
jgi:uncharacterized protein YxjI